MEIKVYETKNYSLFKKLDGNRDVYGVKGIVESIKQVGYIPSPICVNENMEVIDGQNRLEALKSLGMPIHYYIVDGIGIDEARQMNIGRKNWSMLDYIKSYASEGNEVYSYFLEMLEKYKGDFTYRELWAVYKNSLDGRHGFPQSVKQGELGFSIARMKECEPTLETLNEIHGALKKIPGYTSMAIPLFAWILQHPKVDKKRVVKIVNEKYPLFVPIAIAEVTLKDFSKYYNNKLSPNKRISFDIDYRLKHKEE